MDRGIKHDCRRKCVICGITDPHRWEGYTMFFANFPIEQNRCKEWVRAVGKEELVRTPIEHLHQYRHICRSHFETRDFNKAHNKLKKHAIPKFNMTASPLSDDQMIGFPVYKNSIKPSTDGTTSKPLEYLEKKNVKRKRNNETDAAQNILVDTSNIDRDSMDVVQNTQVETMQLDDVREDPLEIDDPEDDPTYSCISLRELWENEITLSYPTIRLCRLVYTAVRVFEKNIGSCLHRLNIRKLTITLFSTKCDATFIKCADAEQRKRILDLMYLRLGCLLIRRQCQSINEEMRTRVGYLQNR